MTRAMGTFKMIRFSFLYRDHPRMVFASLAALVTLGVYQVGTTTSTRARPGLAANSSFAPMSVSLLSANSAAAPAPDAAAGVPRSNSIGINLSFPGNWSHERAFMNLTRGSNWFSITSQGWKDMEADRINPDGTLKSLNPGEELALPLFIPRPAPSGVTIRCTWVGTGSVTAFGETITRLASSANSLEFKWVVNYPQPAGMWLQMSGISATDPVRQIDCRESDAPRDKLFYDDFISSLTPYSTVRFLDWQSINANLPTPRWSNRPRPESFLLSTHGVPVEDMVALAKEANIDPWFLMPWNADEEYVLRFAQYVHDNLPANRKVYVEMSNEVWNWGFPVTIQARDEGIAAGLGEGQDAMIRRYAQKSTWALKLWTRVFADRPQSLVRVVSTQHVVPYFSEQILSFRDTAKYVDAVATAPYFGHDLYSRIPQTASMNEAMRELAVAADESIELGVKQKGVATRFGKRYITYEAGQHVVTANNIPLMTQLNRDPGMYDVYTRYITRWQDKVGGLLMLFNSTLPTAWAGAWGLREYAGQPLSETPKRRAALDYIAAHPN